jgi:hypothetical protein
VTGVEPHVAVISTGPRERSYFHLPTSGEGVPYLDFTVRVTSVLVGPAAYEELTTRSNSETTATTASILLI